jgi:hypothetical protein
MFRRNRIGSFACRTRYDPLGGAPRVFMLEEAMLCERVHVCDVAHQRQKRPPISEAQVIQPVPSATIASVSMVAACTTAPGH